MRVISGYLKGRKIDGYNIDGTRPTMDRVKESIFAIIQNHISDSIVLDLFAGSGNYGIEAISLNSSLVYFNDKNKEAVKVIKRNLENLNIKDKGIVYNLDYLKCLNLLKDDKIKFDLVFLDPPYNMHILNEILEYMEKNKLLNINSYVIVELNYDNMKDEYGNLKKFKSKRYGEKIVYIYKYLGE